MDRMTGIFHTIIWSYSSVVHGDGPTVSYNTTVNTRDNLKGLCHEINTSVHTGRLRKSDNFWRREGELAKSFDGEKASPFFKSDNTFWYIRISHIYLFTDTSEVLGEMRPSLQNWSKVTDVTKMVTTKKEEDLVEVKPLLPGGRNWGQISRKLADKKRVKFCKLFFLYSFFVGQNFYILTIKSIW